MNELSIQLLHADEACRKTKAYVKDYTADQQKAVEWIEEAISRGVKHTYSYEVDNIFRAWLYERGYKTQILNSHTLYIYWCDEKPMSWLSRMCFNM